MASAPRALQRSLGTDRSACCWSQALPRRSRSSRTSRASPPRRRPCCSSRASRWTSRALLAGMVIGALGVLDDVTVSQASTVIALRAAKPSLGFGELYRRALAVGRDHVSATVNTLVLAYSILAADPAHLQLRRPGPGRRGQRRAGREGDRGDAVGSIGDRGGAADDGIAGLWPASSRRTRFEPVTLRSMRTRLCGLWRNDHLGRRAAPVSARTSGGPKPWSSRSPRATRESRPT